MLLKSTGARGQKPRTHSHKQSLILLCSFSLLALVLAACDPYDWDDPNRKDTPKSWEKRPFTEEECSRKGGTTILVCSEQYRECVRPFPDAGTACIANDDCTGACLIDPAVLPVKTGVTTTGFCQIDDNPCGTFVKIEQGIVQPPIVVE